MNPHPKATIPKNDHIWRKDRTISIFRIQCSICPRNYLPTGGGIREFLRHSMGEHGLKENEAKEKLRIAMESRLKGLHNHIPSNRTKPKIIG